MTTNETAQLRRFGRFVWRIDARDIADFTAAGVRKTASYRVPGVAQALCSRGTAASKLRV